MQSSLEHAWRCFRVRNSWQDTINVHAGRNEDDDDDDQDRGMEGPTNLVEWICTLARQTIDDWRHASRSLFLFHITPLFMSLRCHRIEDRMKSDQQWQVSMSGSETKYSMLKQLFDTAAEIVQG